MSVSSSKKNKKKKVITLRRLKNAVLILVGLSVIFLAISFTLIRVAIKSIPDYSMAIQQAVSEQMDMTLEVGFMDAEIYWLVPRLNLFDVNIFDDDGRHHLVHLDEIDLSIDWAKSLRLMSPVVGEVSLSGLNIRVQINKKSQLVIQNHVIHEDIDATIKATQATNNQYEFKVSETLKENFNNINFKVIDSSLQFTDERISNDVKIFSNINLHLINSGDSHVFEVKASLPANYGRYAHFIIEVEGDLFDYSNLDGEVFLALENINAASWVDDYWSDINVAANADINGRFWMQWSGLDIIDVTSEIEVSNLALHYLDDDINTWSIDRIEAFVHWEKNADDWQLDIRDLVVEREGIDWLKPAAVMLEVLNSQQTIKLQADFLRIDGFVYLAGMLNSSKDIDAGWLKMLTQYKPSGALKNLDIELPLNAIEDIRINTEFSQLGFSLPEGEPSAVLNLEGAVTYMDNITWLTMDSKNTEIKFNKLFRNSIDLKKLKGVIQFSHENKLWKANSNSIVIITPHIETESRLSFHMLDNGRPFLDLTSEFKNAKYEGIKFYLPAGVMGADAVSWIDAALKSGRITDGAYQFYGYVGDAPFRGNEGVSLADFNVSDVDVQYLQNWPLVKNVSANLRFVNDTMFIKASKGILFDSKISETTVYIDNFISPTLDVKGKLDMQLQDVKKFVNGSSLRDAVTEYINNLTFSGKGKLSLELFLPLYGDFHTEVGGTLMFEDGSLGFEKEQYKFESINGEIRFAGDTLETFGLTAELAGNTAGRLLNVNVKTINKKNERHYHVDLDGEISAGALLTPLPEVASYINGASNWDMDIDIINDKVNAKTRVEMKMQSALNGITSDLPGPLSKLAVGKDPITLDINIGSESNVNYRLVRQNKDWLELNRLENQTLITAESKNIKGSVDINTRENVDLPIQVNLDYLNLAGFFNIGDNVTDNEDKKTHENIIAKTSSDFSPRDLPSFDFYVDKLMWKDAVYNDSSIKLQKSKIGSIIKSFRFNGDNHVITGKGSWLTGRGNNNITKLDVNVAVSDLGQVFKDMQITDRLSETAGTIDLHLNWQDAPYKFEWKKLQGDGELNLKDGVMKEMNAGAGRILGLFNFKTLLSLDFGNQVKEGFNFDKVKGSFTFSNENIYSDDFEIESKVATIFMKGKLSIANNSLDQVVTVRPHLGGTVTVGTAVVAGPAIGGLVYIFQKIFNTDRLSEYQYSMKGSIDDPDVKLLSVPVPDDEEDSDF